MFCTNCGAKLGDGLNFCTNCGTKLQSVQNVAQTQNQPVQQQVPQQSTPLAENMNFVVPTDKKELKNALFEAVKRNDVQTVESCLNAGIKVDKLYSFLDTITPLGFAAVFDSADVARLLIQRGASIKRNCSRYDHKPLMLAVINNSLATAKVLLDAGADPNSSTTAGRTSLKLADMQGLTEMGQLLMQYGAKVNSVRSVLMKGVSVASIFTGAGSAALGAAALSSDDAQFLKKNYL